MAKFPTAANLNGPANMRGGGPLASVDTSGLERGASAMAQGTADLGRGFMSLGNSLDSIDQRTRQRQNVADVAKAEALWTKGSLELGNRFGQDGDWRTMRERADTSSTELKQQAADLIRDPETKQRFIEQTELRRLATVDAINDHATGLSQQEDRVSLLSANAESAKLISDPNIGDATRKKARADIIDSLEMAKEVGLITPEEAFKLKDTYLNTSDQQLAINKAYVSGQVDPQGVIKALGFPAPGKTGEVAPEYEALDAEKRLQLADHMRVMANQQQVDKSARLAITVQNAPAAISSTGEYSGTMPTPAEFDAAYGPVEGPQRAKAFEATVAVAQTAYGFRTLSNAEIEAAVQSAVPTSSGDDAAIQNEAYDRLATAAQHVLEERKKDPAGYVLSTYPNVAAAWQGLDQDPSRITEALTITATAEKQLGFEELTLLPKDMADKAAATFNDGNLPQEQRVGAAAGLVMSTQDEEQQRAIFSQLVKSGVPPQTRAAMDAIARGDTGAAQYLFRAALTDPKAIKLDTDRFKQSEITNTIAQAMDEGSVFDVVHGVTNGTAMNFEAANADATLIENAVKLRLLDGSATTIPQAVDMTIKDMYGDVRVLETQNVRITMPAGENDAPLRAGFNVLLGPVGDALMADMTPAMDGAATSDGEAAILSAARDQYVDDALGDGYFTNYGDGYVFIDPRTGAYVPGPDGSPLSFSREQVISAGAAMPSVPDAYPQHLP